MCHLALAKGGVQNIVDIIMHCPTLLNSTSSTSCGLCTKANGKWQMVMDCVGVSLMDSCKATQGRCWKSSRPQQHQTSATAERAGATPSLGSSLPAFSQSRTLQRTEKPPPCNSYLTSVCHTTDLCFQCYMWNWKGALSLVVEYNVII